MKRLIILTLAVLPIVASFGPSAPAEEDRKVLVIVKENSSELELMLTKEVAVITDTLEQSGFEPVVASASGQPMVTAATTLTPDLKLQDVKVAEYAGVIMPCMAVGLDAPTAEVSKAAAIVKEAVDTGKPVAAQLSSILILAEAGLLSGKKYSFYSEERAQELPVLKDAVFSGTGVVQDGKVITSGICPAMAEDLEAPDGTAEMTKALISQLTGEK